MKAFHCKQYFCCVEASAGLRESPFLFQMIEQLPSVEEIHYEVELHRRLKCVVKLNNKRVINLL